MSQPSGPLAGITVLDLTSVLYGPYASQTLGDWGAEVIKIEPLTGDTWRYSGQFRNRGMTGQFMAVNRNKRSLALDLKQPDGKAVLQRLIAKADVLLTNIRPAALARLGFGYEFLPTDQSPAGLCRGHRFRPGRTVGRPPRFRRGDTGQFRFRFRDGQRR